MICVTQININISPIQNAFSVFTKNAFRFFMAFKKLQH